MSLQPALVGRAREIDQITTGLARGTGGLVLVGEAGVGKTRLAVEGLDRAAEADLATVRVSATQAAAAIPLGALAPLLPELVDGDNPLAVGRRALVDLAGGRKLALLVDDAHLLDDISATLVLQLAMRSEAFVIVTVRSGERVPDAITTLWKDGLADRLDLAPLDDEAITALVEGVLEGPVDGAVVAAVRAASRGNPLAARELVLAGQESGAVADHGGVWHLERPLPSSPRLTELVEQRIRTLAPAETEALELLAVGEPLGVALLEQMVGTKVVEALERRGLLETRFDGRRFEAWLAHPFHGEVLRSRLTPLGLRSVHTRLAEAVAATGARRRGDVLRISTWRLAAGLPTPPAMLIDAAHQSMRAFSLEAAARLARAAWDQAGDVDGALMFGACSLFRGAFADAEEVLAAAAEGPATDDQRVLLAMTRSTNLLLGLGREAECLAAIETAAAVVTDPESREILVAERALADMWCGRPAVAIEAVEPLLASPSVRPFVAAALAAGPVLATDGRTSEAIQLGERAYAAYVSIWQQGVQVAPPDFHLTYLGVGLIHAGEFDIAEANIDRWRRNARRSGQASGVGLHTTMAGEVALLRGKPATASTLLREADVMLELTGFRSMLRWTLGQLVQALALVGDVAGAREVLGRADALADFPVRFFDAYVAEGRAWLAAADGDPAGARTILAESAAAMVTAGQRSHAASMFHALARLGAPEAALGPLQEIAATRDSPLIAARAAHVTALAAGDAAGLEAASATFEQIGAMLLAAEAAADAARAHRRARAPRAATAATQRARDLAERCEGARTPALAGLDEVVPLTRREREVASLAARGLANRVIAERLYLSERTVENYLQRVYTKLGVTSRAHLPDALGL